MATFVRKGCRVRGAVRRRDGTQDYATGVEWIAVGEVGPDTDWSFALRGVDEVVHLVARTHVLRGDNLLPLYRSTNVDGTRRLVQQAAAAGVRRVVFLSSIKVNGERTFDRPFRVGDTPAPEDAYGVSKREAEVTLATVAAASNIETVVVRSPLVYGPGCKGNFPRLMGLVARGLPLLLGSVRNRRSMVAVDNLADLLVRCADAPEASGRTFLVSDGESLSTPQLIKSIAAAMGRPARLLPAPPWALRILGRLTGRTGEVERLCGSLEVDDRETRELLHWWPPVSSHDAIRATVNDFMRGQPGSPRR